MFPILPILILLLMGPANAERLAVEGRLPAALLAAHRSMVAPLRVAVIAPVEEEAPLTASLRSGRRLAVSVSIALPPVPTVVEAFAPGWPTRAGPKVA